MILAQNVMIEVDGEGSLRFAKGQTLVYARRATLKVQNGVIVNEAGLPLAPRVRVTGAFTVGLDGTILSNGGTAGRLVLARVSNGKATLMNPGEGLAGVIRPAKIAKILAKPTKVTIRVRPETTLDGERILLGSVAEIAGPKGWRTKLATLDLGKLPPLGVSRTIAASYVRAIVRGAGLKEAAMELEVPLGATVARTGFVIETQAILDEATKASEGFVPARPVPPLTVPPGALMLQASPPTKSGAGTSVLVTAMVDGKIAGSRTVALVPDPKVAVVKTGDEVRLRLISGGAAIEMPAKVKTGGRMGHEITVVTATGSLHKGRLGPNGLVEVRL